MKWLILVVESLSGLKELKVHHKKVLQDINLIVLLIKFGETEPAEKLEISSLRSLNKQG
jgi:hypothetical protein